MRRIPAAVALLGLLTFATMHAATAPRPGTDWPQFRGISAEGVAEGFSVPATWNAATGDNVLWKTKVPGLGLSSPVVWGDDVFISTAISGKTDSSLRVGYYGDIQSVNDDTVHEWRVYALDKKTGAIKWQHSPYTGVPKIKRHMKNSHANSTLATDGERLIAFFGSEGLYAYDLKGKLLWKKDLGVLDTGYYMVPEAQWETGSSPVLYDGKIVLQVDVQKNSFLAVFDATDGRELWRVAAHGRADVEHADNPSASAAAADPGQRHAPRRRLRLPDGQGDLEAVGWRRYPGADAGGRTTASSTSPTRTATTRRSTPSRRRRPGTSASRAAPRATTVWRGWRRAAAATCARRWSTAGWSTTSATTAC